MEALILGLFLFFMLGCQVYLAGMLHDDGLSYKDFKQKVKDNVSPSEVLLFGPAIIIIALIKLSKEKK